ncbi:hypothetical protein [Persicirhabdus sediminis]|uniref:Outer membrane protein beta-barrel domain-containing protein n=1 Tax=Persicirhabdus sediminis TaxID=454144 RepID=A0A8J7SN43_9BACT|nr:hypothetical protein [Persicirhabdus sediminis]MBK1791478.1 hypothetical protein [Persicirhabdus sediminis]
MKIFTLCLLTASVGLSQASAGESSQNPSHQNGDYLSEPADQSEQSLVSVPVLNFGRQNEYSLLPGYAFGNMRYSHTFEADYKSSDGSLSAKEVALFTPILPINMGDWHGLVFINYRGTQYDSPNQPLVPDHTLHSVSMPIALLYDGFDDWLIGGVFTPGYTGDFRGSTSDGMSYWAAAAAGYSFGPQFNFYAGAFYSKGLMDDFFMPGIGFNYRPCRDVEIYLLPPFAGVTYSPAERWILSLAGSFDSKTSTVQSKDGLPDRNVSVYGLKAGLRVEHHLYSKAWVYGYAGYHFARNVDIEDLDGVTLLESELEAAPFIDFGFNLRF